MACAKRLRDEYVAPAPVHHTRAHAQISPRWPLLCPNPAAHGDSLAAAAVAGRGLGAVTTRAASGEAATGAAADAQPHLRAATDASLATGAVAGPESGEAVAGGEADAGLGATAGAKAAAAVAAAPGAGGKVRSELQAVRFFDDSRLEVLSKVRQGWGVHTSVAQP